MVPIAPDTPHHHTPGCSAKVESQAIPNYVLSADWRLRARVHAQARQQGGPSSRRRPCETNGTLMARQWHAKSLSTAPTEAVGGGQGVGQLLPLAARGALQGLAGR